MIIFGQKCAYFRLADIPASNRFDACLGDCVLVDKRHSACDQFDVNMTQLECRRWCMLVPDLVVVRE